MHFVMNTSQANKTTEKSVEVIGVFSEKQVEEKCCQRIDFKRLKASLDSAKHVVTEDTTEEEWNKLIFG